VDQESEERTVEIIEFSSPYGRIADEGDTWEFTYHQKKIKCVEFTRAISEIEQNEIRVTPVIRSSMGPVYEPSLKDRQQVLKYSDHEIRKIGKHMSETVIKGPLEIWRQDTQNRYKGNEQQEVQEVTEEVEGDGRKEGKPRPN
jgi:hypothetical protein